MFNIVDVFASARPLRRCLLPPLLSIFLDKEVAANKEGIDDDADADADNTTADEAVPDNNNYATMPPKVNPLPTKTTKKDIAAAAAKPPPPAATAAATSFSVDAEDPLTAHYYTDGAYDYAEGAYNYADVVFCINGTMQMG